MPEKSSIRTQIKEEEKKEDEQVIPQQPKQPKVTIIFGVLLLLALATWILFEISNANLPKQNISISINKTEQVSLWTDALQRKVDAYVECPEGWESIVKPRPFLPAKMYCNRPNLPDNFGDISLLFSTRKLSNISKLEPGYYDQPEFFPNFKTQVLPLLQDYTGDRFALTTPESYPSGTVYLNASEGMTLTGTTLIRSGPLGERYIWLDAKVYFPEIFYWEQNRAYEQYQNAAAVADYFEIDITPNLILFEPAFPVWPKNWTKVVRIKVDIKEDTPPGRYAIGLTFDGTKDQTLVEESYFKWGNFYQADLIVKPTEPWYTMYIEVV